MNSSENFGSSWSARTIVALSNRIISDICNRGHRRKATRLAGQAALTKEIPLLMESDHGFLALLGNHGDLALAVHDVKDSICRISLAKVPNIDNLPLTILGAAWGPQQERMDAAC